MATVQDAVSRLEIVATTDGVDEATASLNKLAEAQGGLAVASATAEKASVPAEKSFANLERRFNTVAGQAAQLEKIQRTVNTAVAQNPALTDRANAVMAAAEERYKSLSGTQSLFEKGLDAAKDRATELSRELGPLGTAITAIGPAGLAVGAAIAVAILALDKLKEQANEAAQWASQLQHASDIIGLNTTQLQALNEAASDVGVSATDNIAAFEKFSVSLGQLKDGSGSLYSELLKVNPALVNQLSVAKDAATGWNLLAQAYSQADKQQQALIARAAFGRGAAAVGGVLQATANAGGIDNLSNENAVAKEQIKRWSDLRTEINNATEAAQHNFQTIFTSQILENEKNFAQGMLSISQSAREFAMSEDLKTFIQFVTNPIVAGILGGAAVGAVGGAFLGGVGAIPGALAGAVAGGVAGAVIKGVADHGATSRSESAVPPAPNFDAEFGALDKANAARVAASLGVQATQAKALVSALGSAATAQEHFDATTKQLNVELANHTITQETYNRAVAGAKLDALITSQNAYMSALGSSASVADIVYSKQLQLEKLQKQNPAITDEVVRKQLALTQSQALGTYQIAAETDAEKVRIATLTMSSEAGLAYQIVQTKINEAKQRGQPLNATEIADLEKEAAARAKVKIQADNISTVMGDLKGGAEAFGNTLVQGLMSGKSAMDSLSAAAKSLGQALVSSGIKNAIEGLASGNFVQAAIGGAEAIGGALLGSDSGAEKEKKNQAAVQAYVRQQQFIQQAQLAGIDQSTLSGQLQAFDINAQQQRLQEQLAGGQAMVQLEQSLAAQRTAIVQKSVDDARKALTDLAGPDQSDVAKQLEAITTASNQLAQGLGDLGSSLSEVTTLTAAAIAKVKASFDSSLQGKINSANGQSYLNDLQSLLTERTQLLSDSASLGSDPNQVAAYFKAQAQSIVDSASLTGDAFNSLLTQFPQLTGVVHQFTGSLKDLQTQIAQYLATLQTGSLSTLSPTDKLNASAQQFQQILAAVQAGDFTKSSQLTSSADSYLNQAQGYFASSAGYATIYDAVTSALQIVSGAATSGGASLSTSLAVASLPGAAVMPQAATAAANDNTAQLFQQQTTAISNVLMQGFNGLASNDSAIGNLIAAKLDQLIALQQQRPKPQRPNDKAA